MTDADRLDALAKLRPRIRKTLRHGCPACGVIWSETGHADGCWLHDLLALLPEEEPQQAHSKSEYKRLKALGVSVKLPEEE